LGKFAHWVFILVCQKMNSIKKLWPSIQQNSYSESNCTP
jgi:hypothetical protein